MKSTNYEASCCVIFYFFFSCETFFYQHILRFVLKHFYYEMNGTSIPEFDGILTWLWYNFDVILLSKNIIELCF